MKFSFFHLMPYTHLELESHEWPFPNRYFDPAKASALYRTYVESMIHADSCGFDWVGCNEHHFSPYGMMANPNLIGGALAYSTRRSKIAITGNLVPLNNPIRVAEEYAMLDCMSGGRLVAGLMRGMMAALILAAGVWTVNGWLSRRLPKTGGKTTVAPAERKKAA